MPKIGNKRKAIKVKSLQSYISDRKKRDKDFAKDYDKGYQDFKIGDVLKQARKEAEEEKFDRFQAAVRIGDEFIANGQTEQYSKELMNKVRHRAVKKAQQGKKVNNSSVTPR